MKPLSIDDVNKMDESQLKEIDLVEFGFQVAGTLAKNTQGNKREGRTKRLNDAMASYDENNSLNNISYY